MRVIQVTAKADADGVIRLAIPVGPAGGEYELAVVLNPRPTANGTPRQPAPEELGWPPGFLERTYGSIQDETFVRHPQPPLDPVEPLN